MIASMQQPDSASFATIVQNHIQHLREHPHIQEITPVEPLVYKLSYWPQDLDSLYSQMVYSLRLTVPNTYPESPPQLVFLDHIYHLNVHPKNGKVFMSILKDDWSPFLNLKSVICSLDEVLQEPDQSHPATKQLLYQYQDDMASYVENVKTTIEEYAHHAANLGNNHQEQAEEVQEVVEQVIQVNDFNYDQLKKNISEQKILIQEQPIQNNLTLKLGNIERKEYSFTSSNQVQPSPRSTKGQKKSAPANSPRQNSKGQESQKLGSKKDAPQNPGEQDSFTKYQAFVKQSKVALSNSNQTGSVFDGLKLNMIRCKELIKIFSDELAELEQNLQRPNGSKRLKKLFEDRCAKTQGMIVELFDISDKIQLKMMDTVRKDFNKYK